MLRLTSILFLLSTCTLALHARHSSEHEKAHSYGGLKTPFVNGADLTTVPQKSAHTLHSRNTHDVSELQLPTRARNSTADGANIPCVPYWLESIKHQELASFNLDREDYSVFRNVKDFGAIGDSVADDTAAIQRAITRGNKYAPGVCESSTNKLAIVYFPGGTYLISSSIIDYLCWWLISRQRQLYNFIDSEISNTPIGIITAKTMNSEPAAAGSLYLENVRLDNVGVAIVGPNGTYLVLDAEGKFYERSKSQYGYVPLTQFLSARDSGAAGEGRTDDTDALNAALLRAKEENKIFFIDAGSTRLLE